MKHDKIFVFMVVFLMASQFSWSQSRPTNQQIVEATQKYQDGQYVGLSCRQFVGQVLREVGLNIGAGYRQAYLNYGVEIGSNEVIAGDIIQISNDENNDDTRFLDGYHSAIVLENYGGGNVYVVHSNWCSSADCYTVSRDVVSFFSWATNQSQKYGHPLTVHFYRLGTVENTGLVGLFSDGYHSGITDKFKAAYQSYMGEPFDNGGGVYVHYWNGVWLQDFRAADGFLTTLVFNPDLQIAVPIRGAIRGWYFAHNSPAEIGAPAEKESGLTRYYNKAIGGRSDDWGVVQKFTRNGERHTLFWNQRTGITEHKPVGLFSLASPVGGTCYIYQNNGWQRWGGVIPFNTIFDAGDYTLWFQDANGYSANWGFCLSITEGNHQVGDQVPSDIIPPPDNPGGTGDNGGDDDGSDDDSGGGTSIPIYQPTGFPLTVYWSEFARRYNGAELNSSTWYAVRSGIDYPKQGWVRIELVAKINQTISGNYPAITVLVGTKSAPFSITSEDYATYVLCQQVYAGRKSIELNLAECVRMAGYGVGIERIVVAYMDNQPTNYQPPPFYPPGSDNPGNSDSGDDPPDNGGNTNPTPTEPQNLTGTAVLQNDQLVLSGSMFGPTKYCYLILAGGTNPLIWLDIPINGGTFSVPGGYDHFNITFSQAGNHWYWLGRGGCSLSGFNFHDGWFWLDEATSTGNSGNGLTGDSGGSSDSGGDSGGSSGGDNSSSGGSQTIKSEPQNQNGEIIYTKTNQKITFSGSIFNYYNLVIFRLGPNDPLLKVAIQAGDVIDRPNGSTEFNVAFNDCGSDWYWPGRANCHITPTNVIWNSSGWFTFDETDNGSSSGNSGSGGSSDGGNNLGSSTSVSTPTAPESLSGTAILQNGQLILSGSMFGPDKYCYLVLAGGDNVLIWYNISNNGGSFSVPDGYDHFNVTFSQADNHWYWLGRGGCSLTGFNFHDGWFWLDEVNQYQSNITAVNETEQVFTIPVSEFCLTQNYPNPFNPTTTIGFSITQSGPVYLSIYNLAGQQVAQLVNGYKQQGNYSVGFDATDLPSGMYIYVLETQEGILKQKMSLLK